MKNNPLGRPTPAKQARDRSLAAAKAVKTRRLNEASDRILRYTKQKDWAMVLVELLHTEMMMERGEI